jgi:hypothetical protein
MLGRRFLGLLVLAGVLATTAAARSSHPGNWGQTVTNAQQQLVSRYPGIASVRCVGDGSSYHFLYNNAVWWNHLFCGGRTRAGHAFELKYHQLGRDTWTITNLFGVGLAEFRTGQGGSPAPATSRFESPSGNIRCAYEAQIGVACYTLSNGLGVMLHSFDGSELLPPFSLSISPGPTLAYGQTWSVSSFRCLSETAGMRCRSTLTSHGFFINRDSRQIF